MPALDAHLARRLVDSQFPRWSGLEVAPVEVSGVDNRTFRLGEDLTIRLPSAQQYALQVDKEHRWLPILAPQLPVQIPVPVAKGEPDQGYPFSWSVYRWLVGETATDAAISDITGFATALAGFLVALRGVEPTDGPAPGAHNFFRGAPLAIYADQTLASADVLDTEVPRDLVLRAWDAAVVAPWRGDRVWFHVDVATGNLLVREGRLAAVIDFGTCGVGDPACDVVIAWTRLSGHSRDAFRAALGVDDDMWARGRGWALWKALISLVGDLERGTAAAGVSRNVIEEVVADFQRHR